MKTRTLLKLTLLAATLATNSGPAMAEPKPVTAAQKTPSAAATVVNETSTIYSLDNNQKVTLSVISTEKLWEVFGLLDNRQDIPFDYVLDGQYARVHKMVLILEEMGIIAGKAVVIGDISFETAFGKLDLKYHMAAIVLVRKNGSPAIYALDPALFSRPVPYEDWKAKTLSGRRGAILKQEYFTNRFAYDPTDRAKNLAAYDKEALEDMDSTNANTARVFGMYLEVDPDYKRVRD